MIIDKRVVSFYFEKNFKFTAKEEIMMNKIAEIDKRMAPVTNIEREGICMYNIDEAPFRIYGVYRDGEKYRRLPEEVAANTNPGVLGLHANTAGGRVRFVTDSPYVILKADINPGKMPHFALTGSCGFDMYVEDADCDDKVEASHVLSQREVHYAGTYMPPFTVEDIFEGVIDFEEKKKRIITVNFPLYSDVRSVLLGLQEGCVLETAPDYALEKPIVYYGSSITQGGCASKPGSSYQSILSCRFNCNYINLGFSGSARAEDAIIEYINGLDMSIFVLDYDHNAPTVEHLRATHNKMFKAIRAAHPDLPILILPRPKYFLKKEEQERHEIVYNTYLEAKAAGDENVYFLSGAELMEVVGDNGTVDNTHPTDSGFFSMAKAIEKVFEVILAKR